MARESKREAGGATAKTSKYDVELAQTRTELERVRNRGLALRYLATGGAWALAIVAIGVAVLLTKGVVHEIAGRKTIIEADVDLKAGLAVSIVFNVAFVVHAQVRRRTIKRLRGRTDKLEQKLGVEIDVE